MTVRAGSSSVTAMYAGTSPLLKAYVGTNLIYESGEEPEPPTEPIVVGSSASATNFLTSYTPDLPSGLQDGDWLVCGMSVSDSSGGVTVTSDHSDWTEDNLLSNQGTTQRALYVATYFDGLEMPSWSLSASRKCSHVCVAVRNLTSFVRSTQNQPDTNTVAPAPAVTADGEGLLVRLWVRKDNKSTSVTLPAGHTLINQALAASSGSSAHAVAAQAPISSAGTIPAASVTWSASSGNGTGWSIAIA
jgi:hypothetical protein